MDKAELKKLLQDNLRLEVSFSEYTYGGENQLEIELKFDGETVCSETVTVSPSTGRGHY